MAPWMILAALGIGIAAASFVALTVLAFLRELDMVDDEGEW